MGYRSDVCIALTDNAARLFKTILDHVPENHEVHALLLEDSADFCDLTTDQIANPDYDCHSKIFFEHIKWYENYDDVSFFEDLLGQLDEDDWLMTRVCEDANDIETQGGFWDSGVYVQRTISW